MWKDLFKEAGTLAALGLFIATIAMWAAIIQQAGLPH